MDHQNNDMKYLVEKILLCDPVTERGREKLRDLGLMGIIHPKDFFSGEKKLWVSPKFDEQVATGGYNDEYVDIYTVSSDERQQAEENRVILKDRFIGNKGTALTVVMGVVGNGKSIEMQRLIFEQKNALPYRYSPLGSDTSFNADITPEAVLIDLEKVCVTIPANDFTYSCPDSNSPLWLFCTKLLGTLYNYIIYTKSLNLQRLKTIDQTYIEHFWNRRVGTTTDKNFFSLLSQYYRDEKDDTTVFECIQAMLTTRRARRTKWDPSTDITKLLDLLFLVMSCVNTTGNDKKSIIVLFDNIEDYIITSPNAAAHIANEQVYAIYRLLRDAAEAGANKYDAAQSDSVLPINMAVRRTTWNLLESHHLGNRNALTDGLFDITGNIRIRDIWDTKKKYIWEAHLRDNVTDEEKKYISFADSILCEGDSRTGRPFLSVFSHIMNHGLRRQAHSGSIIIWTMNELLCGRKSERDLHSDSMSSDYIDMQTHIKLQSDTRFIYSRYLMRHAMIQYYFKNQAIKSGIRRDATGMRWKELNIGFVKEVEDDKAEFLFQENGRRGNQGSKEKIKISYLDTEYPDEPTYRSLLRRVLLSLPRVLDTDAPACNVPTFKLKHLYDVMHELFIRPDSNPIEGINTLTPFKQLARVLLAASRPDREGEYAPFILLRVKFNNGNERNPDGFAVLLRQIWNSKEEDRGPNGKYSLLRYAVRMSENGAEFLTNIHASYDFFAGLYCCNLPPLYFLRSKELIIHIVAKVFAAASELCSRYEAETAVFFRGILGQYERNEASFRMLVSKLHRSYLNKYYFFINQNWEAVGITKDDAESIKQVVMIYMQRYQGQDNNGNTITDPNDDDYKWRCFSPCF